MFKKINLIALLLIVLAEFNVYCSTITLTAKYNEDIFNFFENTLPKKNKFLFSKKSPCQLAIKHGLNRIVSLEYPDSINVEKVADSLRNCGLYEYVEIPKKVISLSTPNDPYLYNRWEINYSESGCNKNAALSMEKAWDITNGNSDYVVAIIDTGIKYNHPEFAGRIWQNSDEIAYNGIDDDKNGYVDDKIGWDMGENDNSPDEFYVSDTLFGWHGTHVAGIIGANGNNATGTCGLDWNCKLMPLKVFDKNGGSTTDYIASAIIYAADNGANVLNMSVGYYDSSFEIKSVIDAVNYAYEKGVIMVAGAGNTNSNDIMYPAKFDKVICVGSIGSNALRSNPFSWGGGSCYGDEMDFVAPGDIIASVSINEKKPNEISYASGTSQASPQVAGLISLMFAMDENLVFEQIYEYLKLSAIDEIGDSEDKLGFDKYYGWGMINPVQVLDDVKNKKVAVKDFHTINENIITVYPTPFTSTNGKMKIRTFENGDFNISIFRVNGMKLYSENLHIDNEITIDLSSKLISEPQGVYVIQLTKNNRLISSIKTYKNN